MSHPTERRMFWRAAFRAPAQLVVGDEAVAVEVHDLSLKGALAEVPAGWTHPLGQPAELRLSLSEDIAITMRVSLAYLEGERAGLECLHIDLDSITHLRRLVELNSGDPAQLERELSHLQR